MWLIRCQRVCQSAGNLDGREMIRVAVDHFTGAATDRVAGCLRQFYEDDPEGEIGPQFRSCVVRSQGRA